MSDEDLGLACRAAFRWSRIGYLWVDKFWRLKCYEAEAIGNAQALAIFEAKAIVVNDDRICGWPAPLEPAQAPVLGRLVDNAKARECI